MDDPAAIFKFVVPQIPALSYLAFSHTIGISATSSKWDLRTAATVHMLRSLTGPGRKGPSPLEKVQGQTLKDPGIKGKLWVAKDTLKKPKEDAQANGVVASVLKAVRDMAKGNINLRSPQVVDIEVEWTGFRGQARKDEPLPNVSEREKFRSLMAEPTRTSEVTILYFHGGAYYLCDPATHRPVCSRLAKESKGRVCSVRYRLAPQQEFPGQLVDALMAYLSLLYPAEGSLHEAIPADKIVFAGDSAGGNLSFGLLQLLLQLHRSSSGMPTVNFNGRDVQVPLPAGASANSGWFDMARCMPSQSKNQIYDYLPEPNHDDALSRFPKSEIWPTDPPRGDLVTDLSMLDHPLLCLILAADWSASPPLWMCTGEECLTDEDLIVAKRCASQGVKVQWEQYEAMPHCFGMLMSFLPTADRLMRSWGDWARRVVETPGEIKMNGVFVHSKTGKEVVLDVKELPALSDEEMWKRVNDAKERRIKGYEKEGKGMPKPTL